MADFCNNCATELDLPVDIDVYRIFDTLKEGYQSGPLLCEGCGLCAVARVNDKLMVMRFDDDPCKTWADWEDYEEMPRFLLPVPMDDSDRADGSKDKEERKMQHELGNLEIGDIAFGLRDEEKEEKIRKRLGWYLELCPRNLFFYPDEAAGTDRDFWRQTRLLSGGFLESEGAHIICHAWGIKGDAPKVVMKFYRHNGMWFFGEAEYQGRMAGAEVWETEERILSAIQKDIEAATPGVEVYAKTKFGRYEVKTYRCKRGDKDTLVAIKEKYRKLYPDDVFSFRYRTRYGRSSHLLD